MRSSETTGKRAWLDFALAVLRSLSGTSARLIRPRSTQPSPSRSSSSDGSPVMPKAPKGRPVDSKQPFTLSQVLLDVARDELEKGAGEVGGNNRGPWVEKYLAGAGLRPPQPWCAAFACWCVHEACLQLHLPMPMRYTASALTLFHECQDEGWQVQACQPGDLVFWHRGYVGSGLGHVGIVEYVHDGKIQTIEGNHTSQVAKFRYTWPFADFVGYIRIPGP